MIAKGGRQLLLLIGRRRRHHHQLGEIHKVQSPTRQYEPSELTGETTTHCSDVHLPRAIQKSLLEAAGRCCSVMLAKDERHVYIVRYHARAVVANSDCQTL
jgi:hypothetical protein